MVSHLQWFQLGSVSLHLYAVDDLSLIRTLLLSTDLLMPPANNQGLSHNQDSQVHVNTLKLPYGGVCIVLCSSVFGLSQSVAGGWGKKGQTVCTTPSTICISLWCLK